MTSGLVNGRAKTGAAQQTLDVDSSASRCLKQAGKSWAVDLLTEYTRRQDVGGWTVFETQDITGVQILF